MQECVQTSKHATAHAEPKCAEPHKAAAQAAGSTHAHPLADLAAQSQPYGPQEVAQAAPSAPVSVLSRLPPLLWRGRLLLAT